MMNFVPFGNFTVIILPNGAVKALRFLIIQRLFTNINDAKKFLVSVVDNFNDGRRGQIAFEDVNAVTLKIIVGKLVQLGEQFGDAGGIFHENHSLRKSAGRVIM